MFISAILSLLSLAAAQQYEKEFVDLSDRVGGAPPDDTAIPEHGHGITPTTTGAGHFFSARQAQSLSTINSCTLGSASTYFFSGYLNIGDLNRNLVSCTTPASSSTTLVGGSHVLYVSNPKGDSLNVYSTDGADCTSSKTVFGYYAAFSDNSNAGVTFKSFTVGTPANPAPCYAATCCTILRCNNWFNPCSVSVYSYFSGVAAASPSKLPSPLASSSSTSSSSTSPSKTPSASASKTPQPSLAPGALPATWDPRTDAKYKVCYTGVVLDQGTCGSCYANAAAHVLSIALCRAAIDSNLQAQMGSTMMQVSTQEAMGIYSQIVGTPVKDLCRGGFQEMVLLSYAVNMHPKLGSSYNLLTCTTPTGRRACSGGCNPYLGFECAGPKGGVVNPSGSAISGLGCSNFYVDLKSCAAGGLDTTSTWLSQTVKDWRVVPSTIDPLYAGKFKTTGQGDFKPSDSSVVPDYRPRDVPSTGWSAADVADIKSYLMTRGPMSLSVGGTPFFMSKWQFTKPYTGDCTTIANHAVTLMGWTASVNGVATPRWIIRNSCACSPPPFFLISVLGASHSLFDPLTSLAPPSYVFSPRGY